MVTDIMSFVLWIFIIRIKIDNVQYKLRYLSLEIWFWRSFLFLFFILFSFNIVLEAFNGTRVYYENWKIINLEENQKRYWKKEKKKTKKWSLSLGMNWVHESVDGLPDIVPLASNVELVAWWQREVREGLSQEEMLLLL